MRILINDVIEFLSLIKQWMHVFYIQLYSPKWLKGWQSKWKLYKQLAVIKRC